MLWKSLGNAQANKPPVSDVGFSNRFKSFLFLPWSRRGGLLNVSTFEWIYGNFRSFRPVRVECGEPPLPPDVFPCAHVQCPKSPSSLAVSARNIMMLPRLGRSQDEWSPWMRSVAFLDVGRCTGWYYLTTLTARRCDSSSPGVGGWHLHYKSIMAL